MYQEAGGKEMIRLSLVYTCEIRISTRDLNKKEKDKGMATLVLLQV